ncbi:MAG: hypothetical protein PUE04_06010 [Lachnospira sp.]|nr:hypothetical protein [Lachnospira sp.]
MGPSGSFPQSYEVFRQPLQKDQKGESIYKSPNPDKEHYVSNMHVTGNTLWLTENEYAADSSYRQDLKAVDLSTGDVRTVLSAKNGWISYVVTDDSVYYSVLNRNANAYGPVQKLSRHLGSTELFIPQGGKLTFDGENFYLADYSQSDGAGSIRIADKTGTVVQTIDAAEIQKLAAKPQVIMFKNHIMIYDLANNPNEPDLYTMQIAKKSDILSGTTDPWTAITAFQSSRN